MIRRKLRLTSTQIIILSFLTAIIIGTTLLCLPFSAASGHCTSFITALFTATTSVCVTGLVVVPTFAYWSLFGKIVILLLIQIGGLGVIAMMTTLMVALGKKITLSSRILLGDAFNLGTLEGLVLFLKKVFKGTFIVESAGALCYMPVFISQYGILKGIWFSVFHSVSAFCNAGIDIVGDTSFMPYVHNIWLNLVTMALIVLGGIGFIVWWDVVDVLKKYRQTKRKRDLLSFSLHTKIVLTATVFLITSGTVLFMVFEYNNPETIGTFSFPQKLLASLFQSVTTRTAGMATISQKGLTVPSVLTSVVLMFIGGSSVGTAGGVKVTTVAVVILSVISTVRGRNDTLCFKRRISEKTVKKSYAIAIISFLASLAAIVILRLFETGDTVDIIYEVYSALGTVGLSRDFTVTLGLLGKIIICICMFLGRIGPISMLIAFSVRDNNSFARVPEAKISVG